MRLLTTRRVLARCLATAGACIPLAGCTTAYAVRTGASSHFVPPNRPVTELGPVKATVPGGVGLLFWAPDLETSALDQKILGAALRQNDQADTIIDYVLTARVQSVWLVFIPFVHWGTLDVEGTAAKVAVHGAPPPR